MTYDHESPTDQAAVSNLTGIALRSLDKEMNRQAGDRRRITVTDLPEPVQLNFGRFLRRTVFETGCKPGSMLQEAPEDGGVDVVVITVKKSDGGSQVVEIGRNSKAPQRSGIKPHGDPNNAFVLMIHDGSDDGATAYFASRADISHPARIGEPYQFGLEGSESSLGRTFRGGEVEKILGFSKPQP